MPSTLGRQSTFPRRYFGRSASRFATTISAPQIEVIRPPWGGFVPDLDPQLVGPSDAQDCISLVARGGELMLDDGFDRIDGARLPLGGVDLTGNPNLTFADNAPAADTIVRSAGSWVTDGFVAGMVIRVSDTVSNNGTFTIDTVVALTITLIASDTLTNEGPTNSHMVSSQPPATAANAEPIVGLPQYVDNAGSVRRFAITADTALGHLYELVTSTWTERPFTGATTGISGNATAPERSLFDWAYYPLGNIMVFTNDVDEVYQFPNVAAGTSYSVFNDHAFSGSTVFRARSVAHYGDRLVFLNTVEGADSFPYRVRWTNINADPDLDPAVTGAGFVDLIDLEGEGLKLLPLGDALACYFESGVLLARRSLLVSDPFRRESVTVGRGLMSTHSVVDLGSGVHFGIFTDGWFFFDATGRWLEAGVRTINGKTHHKFKETFYNTLNWDNRNRVVLELDRTNRFVRIAFPTGQTAAAGTDRSPDTVWVYDIEQDAVWPDTYDADNPNIWGNYDDLFSDQAWDDFAAGDTWQGTGAAWNDFGFRTSRQRPVHGTTAGFVFQHSQDLISRDGAVPIYRWESHASHRGLPGAFKTSDKLHLGYKHVVDADGNDSPPITLRVKDQDGATDTAITPDKGQANTFQTDFVNGRRTGQYLGYGFSGLGPVRAGSLELHYFIHGTEESKP